MGTAVPFPSTDVRAGCGVSARVLVPGPGVMCAILEWAQRRFPCDYGKQIRLMIAYSAEGTSCVGCNVMPKKSFWQRDNLA